MRTGKSVAKTSTVDLDNSISAIRKRSGRPEQQGSCRDNPKNTGSGQHRSEQSVWCVLTATRVGRDNDTSAGMQLSVDRIEPTGYEALTRSVRVVPCISEASWGCEVKYSS